MRNRELQVVGYARYSSDLQREESIEAQERAIREFCDKEGYTLIKFYEDRAQSAKTDNRTAFKQMIADSSKGRFDAIVVHKLDRFARNRYDSAHYKYIIKSNGVKLFSVTERLDDSPESVILESVLEGMAEYYILNLAREVEKGKMENALKCNHTGGLPPLGYNVDKQTKKLVINPDEAGAVKLIFENILKGESYMDVVNELNRKGYKTKTGNVFGKNSLFSILKNEKYCGTYIYNKSEKANSATRKRNGHKYKPEEEIVRIENGCPALISKDDFDKVQKIMKERQQRAGSFKARETYLLSGKIICGECESAYVGNSRKANDTHPQYVSYRCTHKNQKVKCHNGEVNRDVLDKSVVQLISKIVFDESRIEEIVSAYRKYHNSQDDNYTQEIKRLEKLIDSVNYKINNTTNAIASIGFSQALADSLKSLENEKISLDIELENVKAKARETTLTEDVILEAFRYAKSEFENGTLKGIKEIVNLFVDKVVVYEDKVEITLCYGNDLLKLVADDYGKDNSLRFRIVEFIPARILGKKRKHNFFQNCVFSGGEGEIRTLAPVSRPTPLAGAPLRPT